VLGGGGKFSMWTDVLVGHTITGCRLLQAVQQVHGVMSHMPCQVCVQHRRLNLRLTEPARINPTFAFLAPQLFPPCWVPP
jgi:hypothetical protein